MRPNAVTWTLTNGERNVSIHVGVMLMMHIQFLRTLISSSGLPEYGFALISSIMPYLNHLEP
jgi:hypothetical protein